MDACKKDAAAKCRPVAFVQPFLAARTRLVCSPAARTRLVSFPKLFRKKVDTGENEGQGS